MRGLRQKFIEFTNPQVPGNIVKCLFWNYLVNSICFAPHAYGLHLACASSDGKVSILSQVCEDWQSQTISAHTTGCNSVSWAPSAIGSSLLALDFNALDKNPVPLGPKMIATGGCDNTVKLWKAVNAENDQEKWQLESTLNDHTDWVRDVCWRPNLGQAGHILVSCSQDNSVLIWKLDEKSKKWKSRPLKQQPFPDTLWRVSFSEYGHLLAVSCGDNTVTLWRECSEDGSWEHVGNVNENITETVKIDEPLAVAPPPSVPVPEINFTSTQIPKFVADNGYVKPMSPMMPRPAFHSNQVSAGYQQFNQAYDDYQHAQTPTIQTIETLSFNGASFAEAVIPDVPVDSAEYQQQYSYDQSGYGYEPAQYDVNDVITTEPVEEFNKDIGFVGSSAGGQNQADSHNQYQTETYDQYGTQPEQTEIYNQYGTQPEETESFAQYGGQTETYNQYGEQNDQYQYDTSASEYIQGQQAYSSGQEQQAEYNHEQPIEQQYEGYTNYETQPEVQDQQYHNQYTEASYAESTYENPATYGHNGYGESQNNYHETPVTETTHQEGFPNYYEAEAAQPEAQSEQQQPTVDYTMQYEGYSTPASNQCNEDDATRF